MHTYCIHGYVDKHKFNLWCSFEKKKYCAKNENRGFHGNVETSQFYLLQHNSETSQTDATSRKERSASLIGYIMCENLKIISGRNVNEKKCRHFFIIPRSRMLNVKSKPNATVLGFSQHVCSVGVRMLYILLCKTADTDIWQIFLFFC